MANTQKTDLMMEFVALHDIEEGEEIVLDYGQEWEAAWNNHVHNWQAPPHDNKFRSAESYWHQSKLFTGDDWMIEPLASNVMTLCWIDEDMIEKVGKQEFNWLNSTDMQGFVQWHPCQLLSRHEINGECYYDADVEMDVTLKWRVNGIHRRGINAVDRPFTSNQYLRQSFRHEIHLPDSMIPDAWKDREMKEEAGNQEVSLVASAEDSVDSERIERMRPVSDIASG